MFYQPFALFSIEETADQASAEHNILVGENRTHKNALRPFSILKHKLFNHLA
jgi:hypothetical protein